VAPRPNKLEQRVSLMEEVIREMLPVTLKTGGDRYGEGSAVSRFLSERLLAWGAVPVAREIRPAATFEERPA
jgi:hypothetical protein